LFTADDQTNMLETDQVALAFDSISERFDSELENDITRHIRKTIYQVIEGLVQPGAAVLDINCGTGIDAIALEGRGYMVTGLDISSGMINQARRKAQQERGGGIRFIEGSFERLTEFVDRPVNLVLSNFAGLNCTNNIAGVAKEISCVTVPGGFFLGVVMPRFSVWESLSYAVRGDWKGIFRRMGTATPATGFRDGTFDVSYHSPSTFIRAFQPWFSVKRLVGISILSPTPQSMSFYRAYPRLARWLQKLDAIVGPLPLFRSIGDHYLIVFQRKL
jgi:ubiquinone/menaquinone biosynthesis C-methylase UbiE